MFCTFLSMPAPFWGQDDLLDDEAWLGSLLNVEDPNSNLEEDTVSDGLDTESEVDFLAVLPTWSTDLNVSIGTGWRDNALLSESASVSSAFGQIEMDYFALRPRVEGKIELLALLYSEYRYYDEVPGLDVESLSMAQVSADYLIRPSFTVGAVFEGLFSEQAFDASEDEFEPEAAAVSVWHPEFGARVRYDVAKMGTVGLDFKFGEVYYDQESENYDFVESEFAWSHEIGEKHRLKFGIALLDERYDEREERLVVGQLGDRSLLQLDQLSWKAKWKWDVGHPFIERLSTRIVYEEEDDALGDYYERERFQVRQRLGLKRFGWELDLTLAFSQTDYSERRRAALDQERRSDKSWSWSLEASRPMGDRWGWLFRLDGIDKKSNTDGLSYKGNTVYLGCRLFGMGGS